MVAFFGPVAAGIGAGLGRTLGGKRRKKSSPPLDLPKHLSEQLEATQNEHAGLKEAQKQRILGSGQYAGDALGFESALGAASRGARTASATYQAALARRLQSLGVDVPEPDKKLLS